MQPQRRNRGWSIAVLAALATVTGLVLTSPAHAQEGQIRLSDTGHAVAGSYIVVLKNGVAATNANGLAARYGGQLGHTYRAALQGFSVRATESQARKLAADGSVAFVQQNQKITLADTQQNPPSWGLDRVDQHDLPVDNAYNFATNADTVTAFIIDTGVRASHTTFGGRVSGGFDAIDNDNDPDDGNGHGTHVAGTVGGTEYGLAKGVRIVPVRVLDDNGSGTTEQVVAGIDWVAQNHSGPSVANMSLGGGVDDALDTSVRNAISSGVVFAVAAGNSSADATGFSPARVSEAITVAASDDTDTQASFSNFGSIVDIYAPGVGITSSWNTGDTATNTISGTSMATPHVTGAAALYLSTHPDASPADVATALTAAATPDKIQSPGAGTPNKLLFTGS
jgi:subtilisin family serine protease